MATIVLNGLDAPGNNTYFSVWKTSAAEVLDFNDNTFKALGSATTPGTAASELTGRGGVNESAYSASLNLANLNSTPAVQVFVIEFYRRVGGSINLSNDILLDAAEIKVAASAEAPLGTTGLVNAGYSIKCGFNVTSTAGDTIQLYAWVEKDGQPITLGGSDTCSFDLFEFSSGVSAIGGATATVNPSANGQFEDTVTGLTLTDDTEYLLKATCVIGGVTITNQDSYPMIGAA